MANLNVSFSEGNFSFSKNKNTRENSFEKYDENNVLTRTVFTINNDTNKLCKTVIYKDFDKNGTIEENEIYSVTDYRYTSATTYEKTINTDMDGDGYTNTEEKYMYDDIGLVDTDIFVHEKKVDKLKKEAPKSNELYNMKMTTIFNGYFKL